ncbi:hypothetical protein [Methanopyrus kandleri]
MRPFPLIVACAVALASPALAWEQTKVSVNTYVLDYEGDAPNHLTLDVDIADENGSVFVSWFLDGLESKSESRIWDGLMDRVTVMLNAIYDDGKLRLEMRKTFTVHFDYDGNDRVHVYVEGDDAPIIRTEDGRTVLVWEGKGAKDGESGVLKIIVEGIDGRGWKVERREGEYVVVHWTAEGWARIRVKVMTSNSGRVLRVLDISWHYDKEERREGRQRRGVPVGAVASLTGVVLAWMLRSSRSRY